MPSKITIEESIHNLLHVMTIMRDPQKGCAWTRQQTWQSLTEYTLEEAYELVDAIENKRPEEVRNELADVLNQVVFYAQIAEESGLFDFNAIVQTLTEKLIARHPDVFADGKLKAVEQLEKQWQEIKQKERKKGQSQLDDITLNLPALSFANKLQIRASAVGFDWQKTQDVFDKLVSEVDELGEVLGKDQQLAEEELGDVMFSCVNLARHLKVDPERLMRQANSKFERRFRGIELELKLQGRAIEKTSADELNVLWHDQKNGEKNHNNHGRNNCRIKQK